MSIEKAIVKLKRIGFRFEKDGDFIRIAKDTVKGDIKQGEKFDNSLWKPKVYIEVVTDEVIEHLIDGGYRFRDEFFELALGLTFEEMVQAAMEEPGRVFKTRHGSTAKYDMWMKHSDGSVFVLNSRSFETLWFPEVDHKVAKLVKVIGDLEKELEEAKRELEELR